MVSLGISQEPAIANTMLVIDDLRWEWDVYVVLHVHCSLLNTGVTRFFVKRFLQVEYNPWRISQV